MIECFVVLFIDTFQVQDCHESDPFLSAVRHAPVLACRVPLVHCACTEWIRQEEAPHGLYSTSTAATHAFVN